MYILAVAAVAVVVDAISLIKGRGPGFKPKPDYLTSKHMRETFTSLDFPVLLRYLINVSKKFPK